eukprot:TRINITY_DN16784_c0_g1_i2.p1 TRINITY_DN16784_c0_g1~~TRINITY_DN16784_c0_g1_i2.p1  ORF type:complete len:344 (+),score=67.65 TRINITY_DN16784_c0_g1_i2:3-1034(+)
MVSEIGYTPQPERCSSRRRSTSRQGELSGAGAHSVARERSSSRKASWQHDGTGAREAMLQHDAPAPELLGVRTRSRSGKAATEHPRYTSPICSKGFGTVPVNPEKPPTPRGRRIIGGDTYGTPGLLHHKPFTTYTRHRSTSRPRSESPMGRESIINSGKGERDVYERTRSTAHRPVDTLQSSMGVIAEYRKEPISCAWKESPKQLPSRDPSRLKTNVERPPPTPETDKPRGKRIASPCFERTPSRNGVSRSHTPPIRDYSIIAPRTDKVPLHTSKMRSPSPVKDQLVTTAHIAHGSWGPPEKTVPHRRSVSQTHEAPVRTSSRGRASMSHLGQSFASDIITWR